MRKLLPALTIAILTGPILPSVHAAALTWDTAPGTIGIGDGTITSASGIWDATNGNWTADAGANNVVFANNDTVTFGGTTYTATVNGALSVGGITVGTGTGTDRVSVSATGTANTMSLAGIIDVAGSGRELQLLAVGPVANTFTGSFEKTGAGTLMLEGGSGFNLTAITLTAGSLTFNNGAPNLAATTLTLNGGAIGNYGSNNTTRNIAAATTIGGDVSIGTGTDVSTAAAINFTNTVNLNGGTRVLTIGASGSTFSGVVSNGGLTKAGTGTLTLTGSNTYTGTTTISAGTLALSGGNNRLATSSVVAFAGTTGALAGTLTLNAINQTLSSITLPTLAPTGASTLSYTFSGGGGLTVNGASDLTFGPGGVLGTQLITTTVNLSALSSFSFNSPSNVFRVGFKPGTTNVGASAVASATTVTLPSSNTIIGSQLAVGDVSASSSGGANTLHLGAANTINVTDINMGISRAHATLDFTAPSSAATIRGVDGTSAVSTWTLGTMSSNTASTYAVNADFSNGAIDALVNTLTIGNANTGSSTNRFGTVNGAFTMGAGSLTAGTINLGMYGTSSGTVAASNSFNGNGTFNLNNAGGTVNATTINFATNIGLATSGSARTTSGTFNLTDGTLNATTIQLGAQTGNATSVTTNFNWAGGTIGNRAGGDLSVSGVTLALSTAANHAFNISTGQSGTVSSNITGNGPIAKTGDGILSLSGTNSYTGTTEISAGILQVNGTHSGTDAVTVVSGSLSAGTLGGSGTLAAAVNVGTATGAFGTATLAPGSVASPIESLSTGSVTFGLDSAFAYQLNSSVLNGDLLAINGNLTIDGAAILSLSETASGSLIPGSKLTLIAYSGTWDNGTFAGLADDSSFTLGSNVWRINYNDVTGGTNFAADQSGSSSYITLTVIPEPGSAISLLGGLGVLMGMRRRRHA